MSTPELDSYLYKNHKEFKQIGSSTILPDIAKDIDYLVDINNIPEELKDEILRIVLENPDSSSDYGKDFCSVKVGPYDFIICMEEKEYKARLFAQQCMENAFREYKQADKDRFKIKDFRSGYFMAARDCYLNNQK